jgi:hypothetical protein
VINASVMAGIMWKGSGIAVQLNFKLFFFFDRAENTEIQNILILNLFSDDFVFVTKHISKFTRFIKFLTYNIRWDVRFRCEMRFSCWRVSN